jgi:CubicO group peptidase (beta-lactamase class C family)
MTTDATTTDASAGFCDPRFAQVREEFERNFAERDEGGASVCVTVDGEVVVDLWGGDADEDGRPWKRDTIVPVWSSTKGAVALCAHILAASGQLDFNAPVAHYWPEFAQNGKENIPVRMLLNHQAGLAVVREPLPVWILRLGHRRRAAGCAAAAMGARNSIGIPCVDLRPPCR